MIIFKKAADLQHWLQLQQSPIAFVPTMGALHSGHLHLVSEAQKTASIVVCSIFVNPTQFNDQGDFAKYPKTIENDIFLLEKQGCSILFLPSNEEIYENNLENLPKTYELGALENLWEGAYRPGHFQGVCMVVHRLLLLVKPHFLLLGIKDYQQCKVIEWLNTTYNLGATVLKIPTQREASGLALSSRNLRLSDEGKQKAANLYKELCLIRENLAAAPIQNLLFIAKNNLLAAGFEKIDYLALADAGNLTEVAIWQAEKPCVLLAAVFLEGVRLIDNLELVL
ncbi:MAG: pantoate--beta-alanine ligase [Chitinophagaceae bacterium]